MAKDLFPRVASGDILPSEDAVVSTEKLREKLLQEGVGETVVKDCEAIMLSEVSVLQNRLKVLTHKHIILLDTLRQLEVCFSSSLCTHFDMNLFISNFYNSLDVGYMFLAAIDSTLISLRFHIEHIPLPPPPVYRLLYLVYSFSASQ